MFTALKKQRMNLLLGKQENFFVKNWLEKKLYSLLNTKSLDLDENMASSIWAKV
jgi:hypothetical protein